MSEPEVFEDATRRKVPLYVKIILGVILGTLAGIFTPALAINGSEIGKIVITLLRTLATPLILFAVLDAFVRIRIPARKGAILLCLSALNACVAIGIGLGVSNLVRGGERSVNIGQAIRNEAGHPKLAKSTGAKPVVTDVEPTLNPIENLKSYVPDSIVAPFQKNSVIAVVFLAVISGLAIRRVRDRGDAATVEGIDRIGSVIHAGFAVLQQLLEWIILLVPYAVCLIVGGVVAKTGPKVFADLGIFLVTVGLGLFLHAFVYYSLLLTVLGRTNPIKFFRGAADAIVTSLSAGSSLATLPVTLKCLDKNLGVSGDSARLAACVGTNLNHDGIILYEAAAALFICQALGFHLSFAQQMTVAVASVMAGIGIAGVPEAGLITLPLVLKAAGLPDAVAISVFAVILPVDWMLGRCRAMVNVISDMTVATLLDRLSPGEVEQPLV
ncbi:MAG: dicarboxylate/amino acid:cation symporter [Chthonomonadales bacterium]